MYREIQYAYKTSKELLLFRKANDLRIDWHEPDNQDVTSFVIGTIFDNSIGESFEPELLEKNSHEIIAIIKNGVGQKINVNLSTLCASASLFAELVDTINSDEKLKDNSKLKKFILE